MSSDKAYQLMLRVPRGDDGQAVNDAAVEIAERIAEEYGASMVTVCELDPATGETLPLYVGTR